MVILVLAVVLMVMAAIECELVLGCDVGCCGCNY